MIALGLDVGDRRIGVAVSDPTGLIARPVTVIVRRSNDVDVATIQQLVDELEVNHIVVGLPLSSDDAIGPQARKTLAFTRLLRKRFALPVETWDERYSTRQAQDELIASGVRRSRRRERLDAVAAAVLLEEWLTAQRTRPSPIDVPRLEDD